MDEPAVHRTYKRRLQREAFRALYKRMKVDDIFYRIYQPIQGNNDKTHNELIDLDEDDVPIQGNNDKTHNELIDLDEDDVCNDFEQANFQRIINDNENMISEIEDNDSEGNDSVDIQSDASLQNERHDNSDNSEDENENVLIVNENEKEQYLIQLIREWALEVGHLSTKKLDNLLEKLSTVFPYIPKSYKTLLSTPANLKIDKFNDGSEIWYKGIKKNLDTMQMEQYIRTYGKVVIDINIDGLPLFKSSKAKFWPILGYLTMTKNSPFIIAIYFGKTDPQDLNTYLGKYVNEVEGSAYETEKETGRGKRKKIRNRLFEDTDFDEEITKRSKKSVPAPPSVPFKCTEIKKDVIQNSKRELNNRFLSTASFPPTKACSKSDVIERLKKTRKMNNNADNINNASVSHTTFIAHESKHSRNKKSSPKNKVQSIKEEPSSKNKVQSIKDPLLMIAENILPQSSVSSLTVDEENVIHNEENETPNSSPLQSRCSSSINSGFHQRILFSSSNNSENPDAEDKIAKEDKMEKFCERIYVRLEEINKKTDTLIINQGRLNRSLLPNEKKFQKPVNLPALPVKTEEELNLLETFLENDNNLADVCDYCSSFITSKDIAKSTVKIAAKFLTNSMASTMSFKGQNTKKSFYKLKIWEAIQGSLLIKFDDRALFEAEETMKTWLANAPWRKQDNETYSKRCIKKN